MVYIQHVYAAQDLEQRSGQGWPASVVALASVLLLGYEVWPAIALAAFFVNFLSPIPTLSCIGLALGIPAADARLEQEAIQLQRFQDRLLASVSGAYQEVVLSRQRLDPADRELAAAEKALKLAQVTFEGGLLPENDLLLAQLAADQARQRRLTAVTRYDLAQLELFAESGVASADTLSGGA
jgi:hypothetical protein